MTYLSDPTSFPDNVGIFGTLAPRTFHWFPYCPVKVVEFVVYFFRETATFRPLSSQMVDFNGELTLDQ